MNEYPNPSTNIPNAWSQAAQPTNTSSFHTYALNTKWSSHNTSNQSQSSTPTNASALTATFPPYSGGIPPLYPSISAQSSNSIQGGAPSPFGPQNTNSHPSNHHTHTAHGIGGAHTHNKSISQSSSASSLSALTSGMTKLHINTSYNPYNAGFNPSEFNNSQVTTPNIPSSNGPTPTGFRFNNYANPYSNIATPTTPLNATPMNKWSANALQQTAAMNNLNAMNMNYNMHLMSNKYVNNVSNVKATTPNISASSSFNALPTLSTPSSTNINHLHKEHNTKLNSNAAPYQPQTQIQAPAPPQALKAPQSLTQNAINNALKGNLNEVMKSQQLQHQQKAERVPYSYPSYADAVNKISGGGGGAAAVGRVGGGGVVDKAAETANTKLDEAERERVIERDSKMSTESEEAIQKLNPLTWPCNPRHAKFYVIKSFGEDDVHKSIKYNLWCSTERGNRKLDEAFNESKRINSANNNEVHGHGRTHGHGDKDKEQIDPRDTTRGCPVYLFFSVNRSGCFCGMAQMISNYYKDRHFGSWVQDGKWQGSFIVKWIYVKDIPNKDLKDIQLPNNDNRPVTFSRDTQEIPFGQGIEMLRRFIKYEPKTNILQDFKYYDDRERDIKHKRTQQIILQRLQPATGNPANSDNNSSINNSNNSNLLANSNNPNNLLQNRNNNNMPYQRGQPFNRSNNPRKYYPNNSNNGNNVNNNAQIEGYAYRRDNNYQNKRRDNNFQQNQYSQKRKYYSKNERNERNNRYSQNSQRNYANNRYNNNNNNQSSSYGKLQILKRNPAHNVSETAGNNANNNISKDNANKANSNQVNEMDNANNENSPNRGRYNRNRNRWVPK